jgi:PIN domain nuclease of toxin-antitoxin system
MDLLLDTNALLWSLAGDDRLGRPATLLAAAQLSPLPVSIGHALLVADLPRHHADPFDRLLIAQAARENLIVVTGDAVFERYDVRIIRC